MGAGRGAGRNNYTTSLGDSVRRGGRMLFFLVNMLGSLFISCGPLLVSILDIGITFAAFTTCCSSCSPFRADWATYSFRGSLVDVPLLSLARSLAALCTYALCGEVSLWYLGATIVSAIGSAVMLSLKASLHHGSFNRGLPLLFFSSAVLALAHIVVAYKARYQARRKLGLDGVSSMIMSMNGYQRVPAASSPKFFRRNDLESNLMSKPS